MQMSNVIIILQIIISVSLSTLIILQSKGVGLGRAWGGGGGFYKSRRGVEKIIFNLTIVLAALFLITSILSLLYT